MKLMQTAELTGDALDWAVAKAVGLPDDTLTYDEAYCTRWELTGPLIDEARISVLAGCEVGYTDFGNPRVMPVGWRALGDYSVDTGRYCVETSGSTAIEAALRCYVILKLGRQVEIPKGLCK